MQLQFKQVQSFIYYVLILYAPINTLSTLGSVNKFVRDHWNSFTLTFLREITDSQINLAWMSLEWGRKSMQIPHSRRSILPWGNSANHWASLLPRLNAKKKEKEKNVKKLVWFKLQSRVNEIESGFLVPPRSNVK